MDPDDKGFVYGQTARVGCADDNGGKRVCVRCEAHVHGTVGIDHDVYGAWGIVVMDGKGELGAVFDIRENIIQIHIVVDRCRVDKHERVGDGRHNAGVIVYRQDSHIECIFDKQSFDVCCADDEGRVSTEIRCTG